MSVFTGAYARTLCFSALLMMLGLAGTANAAKQMENINRGVVAVSTGSGIYVGWRLLGTDPANISFNVYRGGTLISSPITNSTNYLDTGGSTSATYTVRPIIGGVEQAASETASVWTNPYLAVDLQRPAGGTTPDGVAYTYEPNDLSTADLDGDGQYELVVKWYPSNAKIGRASCRERG